jgi:hypothetical protein
MKAVTDNLPQQALQNPLPEQLRFGRASGKTASNSDVAISRAIM